MVPYAGGVCTARVSRDGRVLEAVSGFVAANAATGIAPRIRTQPAGVPTRVIEGAGKSLPPLLTRAVYA